MHDHPALAHDERTDRSVAVARAPLLNRISLTWNFAECSWPHGRGGGGLGQPGRLRHRLGHRSGRLRRPAWRLWQERRPAAMPDYDRTAHPPDRRRLRGRRRLRVGSRRCATSSAADHPDASPRGHRPGRRRPSRSMPVLARAKRALAPALGSQAVDADADQTSLCALVVRHPARRVAPQRPARLVVGRPGRRPRPSVPGPGRRRQDLERRVAGRHLLRLSGRPSYTQPAFLKRR